MGSSEERGKVRLSIKAIMDHISRRAQFLMKLKWLQRGKTHQRPLTFSFESCENKDEIVVKVGELVELFKFLARQLRTISL